MARTYVAARVPVELGDKILEVINASHGMLSESKLVRLGLSQVVSQMCVLQTQIAVASRLIVGKCALKSKRDCERESYELLSVAHACCLAAIAHVNRIQCVRKSVGKKDLLSWAICGQRFMRWNIVFVHGRYDLHGIVGASADEWAAAAQNGSLAELVDGMGGAHLFEFVGDIEPEADCG